MSGELEAWTADTEARIAELLQRAETREALERFAEGVAEAALSVAKEAGPVVAKVALAAARSAIEARLARR